MSKKEVGFARLQCDFLLEKIFITALLYIDCEKFLRLNFMRFFGFSQIRMQAEKTPNRSLP